MELKMSYDEVINNLECSIKRYRDATYHVSCVVDINILKNALDTIKKQKSEIDRLQKENESIRYCYRHAISYNNQLLDACECCMKGKTEKIESIKKEK